MKAVHVPAHLVLILKRIVNAVSTLSISNHYLVQYHEHKQRYPHQRHAARLSDPFWKAVRKDWPWWSYRHRWRWPREDLTARLSAYRAHTHSAPSPWLNPKWTWSSLLSLVTPSDYAPTPDFPPPPSPPPNTPHRNPFRSRRNDSDSSLPPRSSGVTPNFGEEPYTPDTIHTLLQNPTLYDPVRTPRYPMVLCHGLYGFDSRGPSTFPSLRMHYWANVLNILRKKAGAEVIVTSVPATGSISSRAKALHEQLMVRAYGRGVNLLAHSMGGLDCRQLITHIQPTEYTPLSLTSVATPHRGSPFMDWCVDNIGIGKLPTPPASTATSSPNSSSFAYTLTSLPSSVTTLLLSIVDSPAYANLTSSYLNNVFNPNTPDDPHVKYFSIAGRMSSVNIFHPFWFPKMVLDGWEEKQRAQERKQWEEEVAEKGLGEMMMMMKPRWADEREWGNDGLVTVQSARWGELLGIMEGCDHWEMRGARGLEFGVDLPALPSFSLGGVGDWNSFMGAWRKAEKKFQEVTGATGSSATPASASNSASDRSGMKTNSSSTSSSSVSSSLETSERERQRQMDWEKDDAVVKSSTEKLSAVFDWIMQLPVGSASTAANTLASAMDSSPPPPPPPPAAAAAAATDIEQAVNAEVRKSQPLPGGISRETERRKANELATKEDLERLYVAMMRKLYDEGL